MMLVNCFEKIKLSSVAKSLEADGLEYFSQYVLGFEVVLSVGTFILEIVISIFSFLENQC